MGFSYFLPWHFFPRENYAFQLFASIATPNVIQLSLLHFFLINLIINVELNYMKKSIISLGKWDKGNFVIFHSVSRVGMCEDNAGKRH